MQQLSGESISDLQLCFQKHCFQECKIKMTVERLAFDTVALLANQVNNISLTLTLTLPLAPLILANFQKFNNLKYVPNTFKMVKKLKIDFCGIL